MAHPDIDRLLNVLITMAKQMLDQTGEFYPFSAALDPQGLPTSMPAGEPAHQDTAEAVIERLVSGLRDMAGRGEIRASGICLDAWVVPPSTGERTDAIELRLEQASGQAVRVFLPYTKGFEGKLSYGELFATLMEPSVFEAPTSSGDATAD
mgnify:CR=1 FL=1